MKTLLETTQNTSIDLSRIMAAEPQKVEYSRNGKDFYPKSGWTGFNSDNTYHFYFEKSMNDIRQQIWG